MLHELPVGIALPHGITDEEFQRGEKCEYDLDRFIECQHDRRVRMTGRDRAEEAAWAASERREAARRAREKYEGDIAWARHLRMVYTGLANTWHRKVMELQANPPMGTTRKDR